MTEYNSSTLDCQCPHCENARLRAELEELIASEYRPLWFILLKEAVICAGVALLFWALFR